MEFSNFESRYKEMIRRGFSDNGLFFERENEIGSVNYDEITRLSASNFKEWVEKFPITEPQYQVERALWFFAKTDKVYESKLKEYYTDRAIASFLKYGYIKRIES